MKRFLLTAVLGLLMCALAAAQGFNTFRLNNGLTVFVWEDPSKPDVYGEVVVRAGSVNDPSEYTGLAHYLEHVMFKGTSKIGTLDWASEAPVYEQIIAKYDEMAQASDQATKDAISAQINALTIEAGKYSVLNEYNNLIESIGGIGLNAATSYDMTFYHNSFPPNQISKWLSVASERFINPVFRAFQSELETVYEEYNMYQDSPNEMESEFLLGKIFEGEPYARPIIGLGEHLKNPRLSKLIEFYKKWYVPSNMALILVGNVNTKAILRLVNATFGRIPMGPEPEREPMDDLVLKGRNQYTFKYAQYPSVTLAYNGVPQGAEDEVALELCMELLSNSMQTGILDAMSIAGDVMGASASSVSFAQQGRCIITAVPYYDRNQGSFDSSKKVEKLLQGAVSKLTSGEISQWSVDAIKTAVCRDFDLAMEDNQARASFIRDIFIGRKDVARSMDYKALVSAITIDDIKRVATKYLGNDYIVIYSEQGRSSSSQKIKKPSYEPLKSTPGSESAYATWFKGLSAPIANEEFADWSKVSQKQINDYSRLYYSRCEANEVFNLSLRYGAGSHVFPLLEYAASLMDEAGVMATYTPQKLKEHMARLGVTLSMDADDEYFYVNMRGYEESLQDACRVLFSTLMMPSLEEKQLDNLKGSLLSSRMIRKKNVNMMASALREYVFYDKDSRYLNEVTDKKIYDMSVSDLTGSINKAAGYAAEIFYSGRLPFEKVYSILSTNLPLVQGEKPSESPIIRSMRKVEENTVFFVANNDAQQAQIYIYIPAGEYNKEENVVRNAFNRYFGGGFGGIVLREIRENNSMAYTATGGITTRKLPGAPLYFSGYVGTQNDKVIDALKLYMSLLNDMPEEPQSINLIKDYLHQASFTTNPDDRGLTAAVAEWKLQGYDQDPSVTEIPQIDALTFEDVVAYYKAHIQGRPMAIGIIGNPKAIGVQNLSQFGKVVRMTDDHLFNDEDKLF